MKRSFLAFIAPFVFAGSLHAAADYLLEIDGIKGESADTQRPGTIEIESFSWGASNSGAGGGAGKVSFSDLHFTTKLSKATPQLLLACASGNRIPKATLYVRKAGGTGEEYYMVVMEDVLVSSMQQSGHSSSSTTGGDPKPTEEVAFNFDKVAIAHTADDGTTTRGEAVRTPE